MLQSVEGFWISASIFGDGSHSVDYHATLPRGTNVYASIALSNYSGFGPNNDPQGLANAYIESWLVYNPDGTLTRIPAVLGQGQNAMSARNCGGIKFVLTVASYTSATAQINLFRF